MHAWVASGEVHLETMMDRVPYRACPRRVQGFRLGLAASVRLSSLSSGSIDSSPLDVLDFARIASSYSLSLIEVLNSQS